MLRLTESEIRQVQGLLALLHGPLDAPDLKGWRGDINRRIQALFGARSVNFTVPFLSDSPSALLGIEERAADDYFGYFAERDPGPAIRQARGLDVCTQDMIYPSGLPKTELYNEFFIPHHLVGSVGMNAPLPDGGLAFVGVAPDAGVSDHGPRFMALLNLLLPAFQAGIRSLWKFRDQRSSLSAFIDALGDGAAMYSTSGKPVHVNPAMQGLLEAEPERARLEAGIAGAVRATAAVLRTSGPLSAGRASGQGVRAVRTARGEYSIHGSLFGSGLGSVERLVLVVVERPGGPVPDRERIRHRFGLTARESEVALLLSRGSSDRRVAEELTISWHTARRHTERVLRKVGVSSRAELATRLLEG